MNSLTELALAVFAGWLIFTLIGMIPEGPRVILLTAAFFIIAFLLIRTLWIYVTGQFQKAPQDADRRPDLPG